MIPQLRAIVSIAAIVILAPATILAKPKVSTPEERAKAAALAHELESQPQGDEAAAKRAYLIKWWEKVPDLTVTICDLLGPIPKEDHPVFPQVLAQSMFSSGAFIIEHPEQANDKLAVQTAGIQGALKVYEALAKGAPDARLPFLDDLLKKRDTGVLESYMREAVPKACS